MESAIKSKLNGIPASKLDELTLDGVAANTITGLTDEFTSLTTLSMNNMRLQSLEGFPSFPKLARLELNDNRLTGGLEHLIGCPALMSLSLMNNRLKDRSVLEPLKALPNLRVLDIERNDELQQDDMSFYFDLLPQLKFINGKNRLSEDIPEEDESDDQEEEDEYESDENGDYSGSESEDAGDLGDEAEEDVPVDDNEAEAESESDDEDYDEEGQDHEPHAPGERESGEAEGPGESDEEEDSEGEEDSSDSNYEQNPLSSSQALAPPGQREPTDEIYESDDEEIDSDVEEEAAALDSAMRQNEADESEEGYDDDQLQSGGDRKRTRIE